MSNEEYRRPSKFREVQLHQCAGPRQTHVRRSWAHAGAAANIRPEPVRTTRPSCRPRQTRDATAGPLRGPKRGGATRALLCGLAVKRGGARLGPPWRRRQTRRRPAGPPRGFLAVKRGGAWAAGGPSVTTRVGSGAPESQTRTD